MTGAGITTATGVTVAATGVTVGATGRGGMVLGSLAVDAASRIWIPGRGGGRTAKRRAAGSPAWTGRRGGAGATEIPSSGSSTADVSAGSVA